MAASDNTFNEAMQKILSQLAIAGTLPDADIEFLAQIQAAITQKLREGANGAGAGQQAAMQMGPDAMGQPGGMPPGGMPPQLAQQGPGGAMPGLVPSAPNMDEIRRMIGATGAVQ